MGEKILSKKPPYTTGSSTRDELFNSKKFELNKIYAAVYNDSSISMASLLMPFSTIDSVQTWRTSFIHNINIKNSILIFNNSGYMILGDTSNVKSIDIYEVFVKS